MGMGDLDKEEATGIILFSRRHQRDSDGCRHQTGQRRAAATARGISQESRWDRARLLYIYKPLRERSAAPQPETEQRAADADSEGRTARRGSHARAGLVRRRASGASADGSST